MSKNIGFFDYIVTLLTTGWNRSLDKREWESILCLTFLMAVLVLFGGDPMPVFCIFGAYGALSILILLSLTRSKPALFHLIPITPRRKTVYLFLGMLFFTIGVMIATILVELLVAGIICLIVFATSGENAFVFEEGSAIPPIGLQGTLFSVILGLLFVGAALLIATLKNRKLRGILTVSIWAPLYALLQILTSVGNIEKGKIFLLFDTIPHSEVVLIVLSVAAAAMIVFGTVKMIKQIKN